MGNVRARLSDEAYEAIEKFCAEQGITITSALEAWGRRLARGDYKLEGEAGALITEARQITADRKSRKPKRKG